MGSYSSASSEDDRRRHHKKKKKRRSTSCSSVESHCSSTHRRQKRSKKTSKHKRRSRSRDCSYSRGRSQGRDHPARRSRSRSTERRRHRSRTRRSRRSRSKSPRESRRSRSGSQSNGSRQGHRRRWSRSSSRKPRVRRRSESSGSESHSRESKAAALKKQMTAKIAGYQDMTVVERAQAQMHLALKAAAAADEQLQEQGVLLAASRGGPAALTATDAADRSRALDAIDDDAFVPAAFSSSRHKPMSSQRVNADSSHENAIFGLGDCSVQPEAKPVVCMKIESLMHPNLYASAEKKAEIWIEKLTAMIQTKMHQDKVG